jgi:hypothetical protein
VPLNLPPPPPPPLLQAIIVNPITATKAIAKTLRILAWSFAVAKLPTFFFCS